MKSIQPMLQGKKNKQIYICNEVFTSVTGHMNVVDTRNYLHPSPIPDSFCTQQVPQLIVVLYLVTWPKHLFTKGLGYQQSCLDWVVSFPLTLIREYDNSKRFSKVSPIFQTYSSLPLFWDSSPISPWSQDQSSHGIFLNIPLLKDIKGSKWKSLLPVQWNPYWPPGGCMLSTTKTIASTECNFAKTGSKSFASGTFWGNSEW